MENTLESKLNIICLETDAFYSLVEEVVKRLKDKQGEEPEKDNWIDEGEAMKLLHISSKTTLQKYRDERRIVFNPINRRVILYSRTSIDDYLQKSVQKPYK